MSRPKAVVLAPPDALVSHPCLPILRCTNLPLRPPSGGLADLAQRQRPRQGPQPNLTPLLHVPRCRSGTRCSRSSSRRCRSSSAPRASCTPSPSSIQVWHRCFAMTPAGHARIGWKELPIASAVVDASPHTHCLLIPAPQLRLRICTATAESLSQCPCPSSPARISSWSASPPSDVRFAKWRPVSGGAASRAVQCVGDPLFCRSGPSYGLVPMVRAKVRPHAPL